MKSSKVYTDLLRAKLLMLKKVEKAAAAAEQPDVVDEPAAKKLRRTTKRGKSKSTKATNVPAPQDPEDNGVWTGITIAEEDTCNNRYVAQVLPKCVTQELRELRHTDQTLEESVDDAKLEMGEGDDDDDEIPIIKECSGDAGDAASDSDDHELEHTKKQVVRSHSSTT